MGSGFLRGIGNPLKNTSEYDILLVLKFLNYLVRSRKMLDHRTEFHHLGQSRLTTPTSRIELGYLGLHSPIGHALHMDATGGCKSLPLPLLSSFDPPNTDPGAAYPSLWPNFRFRPVQLGHPYQGTRKSPNPDSPDTSLNVQRGESWSQYPHPNMGCKAFQTRKFLSFCHW